MTEAADEKLYGLIEIAERQQATAQTVLDGLATERTALGQDREELRNEINLLNQDIRSAVLEAVSESMARAAEASIAAVKETTEPLLSMVTGVSAQATQAEAALRTVTPIRGRAVPSLEGRPNPLKCGPGLKSGPSGPPRRA